MDLAGEYQLVHEGAGLIDVSQRGKIELVGPDGVPLARGLVAYDATELPALLGVSTRETGLREVVHRDDLVLLPR